MKQFYGEKRKRERDLGSDDERRKMRMWLHADWSSQIISIYSLMETQGHDWRMTLQNQRALYFRSPKISLKIKEKG